MWWYIFLAFVSIQMQDIFETKKYLDERYHTNQLKYDLKELKIDVIIPDDKIKAKVRRYMYTVKSFVLGFLP